MVKAPACLHLEAGTGAEAHSPCKSAVVYTCSPFTTARVVAELQLPPLEYVCFIQYAYIYIYIYIIIYIYIYVIYKHESFESHKKPSSCGAQVFGMEHPKQFHTVGVSPALASAVLFKFANGAQHLTARGRIALSRADAMRCAGAYNKYNTFISSQQPLRCFLSLLQPLIRGSVRTPLLHT